MSAPNQTRTKFQENFAVAKESWESTLKKKREEMKAEYGAITFPEMPDEETWNKMESDLWSEVIMRTDLAIEKKREQAKTRNMMQDATIKEHEEMIRSPRRVVENFIKAHFVSMLAKAGLV
eukprot:5897157-Karenia_brevis.AAC.1